MRRRSGWRDRGEHRRSQATRRTGRGRSTTARNTNQPAPSSPEATSRPRTSRRPSPMTSTATRAWTFRAAGVPDLDRQPAHPQERVMPAAKRPAAERLGLRVQMRCYLPDLAHLLPCRSKNPAVAYDLIGGTGGYQWSPSAPMPLLYVRIGRLSCALVASVGPFSPCTLGVVCVKPPLRGVIHAGGHLAYRPSHPHVWD